MKKLLILAFLFLGFALSAQNVTINAVGKNIGGKHIRLFLADDYISGLEVQKADVKLGENDSTFSFGLVTDGVSILTLKIDAFEYSFISQPGKIYELQIDSIDYAVADSVNVLLYKYILPIKITNLDSEDLNIKINKFDVAIENFITRYDRELLVTKEKNIIDSLYQLAETFLQNEKDGSYFHTYVKYELGKMNHVLRLKSRKQQRVELCP